MYTGTMKKVGIISILSAIMLVVMSMVTSMTVQADNNDSEEQVIDEKWGMPVYVYGSALTEKEAKSLAEDMGYDFDNLETYIVDAEDLNEFLDDANSSDSSMYSSVIIERKEEGYGIEVEIPNSDRITRINKTQYENAMTTSGVTDAKVIVDSPKPVTGESALSGIYKAYDEKGEELDKERMELGQDELDVTSDINEDSKDSEGYDEDELNAAIVDIKQQLSEMDEAATKEDVEEVVNKVLDERGVGNAISEDNVNKLVEFADNYRGSSAIDSDEVKEQLKDISKDVTEKAKDIKDKLDESGFWEKLGNFFKDLWKAIANFFNSIFE